MPIRTLPPRPSMAHLKSQARDLFKAARSGEPEALERLNAHRLESDPRVEGASLKLHQAQLALAREYSFPSWRALKAEVEGINLRGDLEGQAYRAATTGDAGELDRLLTAHPELLDVTVGNWKVPLGHHAGEHGQLACIEVLVRHGYDFRRRCEGDHAYALHFAAEQGHLVAVKRLLELTGDVHGEGDLHERGVLGWATCFAQVQEDVAAYLLDQGARTDIFSAISLNRREEVRRFITGDPAQLTRPMSRFEHHRQPLHHAVRMNRPEMVRLLLEAGADPNARDDAGQTPLAEARGDGDPAISEALVAAGAELGLAEAIIAGRFARAEELLAREPAALQPGGRHAGLVALMASKSNLPGLMWLLEHGADPNAKELLWDCNATGLHFAAEQNHLEIIRALLAAGADPLIEDDKHHADAYGWAHFFERKEVQGLLGPRPERDGG